jgi:hypothetical protein
MEIEKIVLEVGKGNISPGKDDEVTIKYSGKISSNRPGRHVLMSL